MWKFLDLQTIFRVPKVNTGAAKSSTVEVSSHTAGTTPQFLVPIMARFSK